MADEAPGGVDSKGCAVLLDRVAPASPQFAQLLELPDKLFVFGGAELSLSSDPSTNIAEVEDALASSMPLPARIPDYGLHVVSHASRVSCTLVDRQRRIIVMHSVTGVLSEHRSWDSFMYAVEHTAAIAAMMRVQGEEFAFVVNKESAIRIIRP
jgi:hypothetical protein